MTKNISITVNEENLKYLDSQIKNRSKYINELIEQDRRSKFEARMRAGYIAQSQNQEIQEEDLLWEVAITQCQALPDRRWNRRLDIKQALLTECVFY